MPRVGAIGIVCALAAALAASAAAHEINLHKLPLGDGKLSHAPKRGWIWACHIDPQAGGAQVVGPWINLKTKTYDLTAKLAVRGSVTVAAQLQDCASRQQARFHVERLSQSPDRAFPDRAQRSGLSHRPQSEQHPPPAHPFRAAGQSQDRGAARTARPARSASCSPAWRCSTRSMRPAATRSRMRRRTVATAIRRKAASITITA